MTNETGLHVINYYTNIVRLFNSRPLMPSFYSLVPRILCSESATSPNFKKVELIMWNS